MTFKNPCIDKNFVNIVAPQFFEQDYIINAPPEQFPVHAPFTVNTVPITHDYCGSLTFVPKFNDQGLVSGGPLTYSEAERQFTADSDDITLIGQIIPFSVEAEFADYPLASNPSVSTAAATADVEFDNPCLDPFVFESTAQTDPTQTAYSDTPIVFNLNRFTIDPPRCKIAYTCTSVVR